MTTKTTPTCALCGEPMPEGEEMFKYHGYSGPCPKPALLKLKGYDPECQKLAEYFMPSAPSPRIIKELSQAIQDAVEDYMTSERDRLARELCPTKQ